MDGLVDDGGTSLANVLSTWLPVLSVALMILFAALAARRSMWSWAAAGLSVLIILIPSLIFEPGLITFQLWPFTLLTLLAPVFGWWNWKHLSRLYTTEKVPIRHATRKHYLIGGILLLIPALMLAILLFSNDAWAGLPPAQWPLAMLGLIMPGLLFVALLGLAIGLIESWWLLLLDSAWHLVPAVLDLNTIAPPGVSVAAHTTTAVLHAGVIVAAVLGYRTWKSGIGASPQTARLQGNL